MRNFFLKGVAALTMGLAMTACTKDFNYEVEEQKASIDNAQQTLGFYIPDNQDWVLSTTATATFNIKGLSDDATVYVFSNYPEGEGYGSVLASGKMTGTTTILTDFRIPSYLKKIFVGLQQSDGSIMYKYVDVVDNNISADYDFSTSVKARTRSIIPEIGDPFTNYSETELNEKYKTSVPTTAVTGTEVNNILSAHYNDGNYIQGITEIALQNETNGFHFWQGARDIYVVGTVTLNVDGTNSMNQARIYLLPNSTLNLNMSSYINNLEIYVASNATLNYNAEKLYKQDGGGMIFNRGTLNLQDNFEANQNSIVYNEGTVNGKDITSKPGDGNSSYFYNFGDLELTGDMVLNSCANFYNEGTVKVAGETNVTQQKIYWINKGNYTTGTMIFSAKNTTFYNYCQLLVKGNAHMYDGAFNLMSGSYTEAGTAEFDNFYVNIGANSGFNVKGDNYWGPNGDGEFQGFNGTGDNIYVRLGGTTTIAEHKYSLVTTGTIKIAINNKVDLGANNSGVWPTFERRDNSKEVPFAELNATPNEEGCGATWGTTSTVVTPQTENQTWTYAFEDNKTRCDFDMNDVVIQVRENEKNEGQLIVTLVAAGCEYDNYVWLGNSIIEWPNGREVHDAFGINHGVMVNTGNGKGVDLDPVSITIPKPANFDFQNPGFKIRAYKINSDPANEDNARSSFVEIVQESNPSGLPQAPVGIAIPDKWKWPKERVNVTNAYEGFIAWGSQDNLALRAEDGGWYKEPASGLVYGE